MRWLAILALCLAGVVGADEADDWQASVTLQAVGAPAVQLPPMLVPKQSVLLTVTVWMPQTVNWYPRYPQWDMPGATLLPLMMLSPSIEREHGTFTQRGATQNYLLTPLAEGRLQLTPASIKVYPDQAESPQLPFTPVALQVALPDGAGSLEHFLPATALKLTQAFYLQTGDGPQETLAMEALGKLHLQRGQMLERRITLEAKGIQGNQIPALPVDADAVQHQAETADLNNYGDFSGSTRTEHWFYAAGTGDTLALQPLAVRWYDTGAQTFKTAHLDGATVRAQAASAVDPRLELSWHDRLALLSPWQVGLALAVLVLLGMAVRYGRPLGRWCRRRLAAWQRTAREAEPCLFLRMCVAVAVCGLKSRRACWHFERWQLRAGATHRLDEKAAIRRWSQSRFAAGSLPLPRRWTVLAELLALRDSLRRHGRSDPGRTYDLPPL